MTERRLDPTSGEWRVVAERRLDPTTGEWREVAEPLAEPAGCDLCPTRPGSPPTRIPLSSFEVAVVSRGAAPDTGSSILTDAGPPGAGNLYAADSAVGVEEVVVYSDDHGLALAGMEVARIAAVVDVWADRYAELGGRDDVAYVLVSEDRGAGAAEASAAGHPHSRVQAYPVVPPRPRLEIDTAIDHLARLGTCVFCDVVARELGDGIRLVARNSSFLAFVPFAPRFPYEVHLISHRHAASLLDLTDPERVAMAGLLKRVLAAYDDLFGSPAPYAMSVHQAPTDDGQHQSVSHLHVELTPRQPGPLGSLGGAELGGGAFTTHIAPELAATHLRDRAGAR